MAIQSFPDDDSEPFERDPFDTDWGCVSVVLAIIGLLAVACVCETVLRFAAPPATPPAGIAEEVAQP